MRFRSEDKSKARFELTSRTREGCQCLPSVKRSMPAPVASEAGERSSQMYTQPGRRAARSAASRRRVTMGSMPQVTA